MVGKPRRGFTWVYFINPLNVHKEPSSQCYRDADPQRRNTRYCRKGSVTPGKAKPTDLKNGCGRWEELENSKRCP